MSAQGRFHLRDQNRVIAFVLASYSSWSGGNTNGKNARVTAVRYHYRYFQTISLQMAFR
jgi:hypothetical protein